jgi:hypothetical protein
MLVADTGMSQEFAMRLQTLPCLVTPRNGKGKWRPQRESKMCCFAIRGSYQVGERLSGGGGSLQGVCSRTDRGRMRWTNRNRDRNWIFVLPT